MMNAKTNPVLTTLLLLMAATLLTTGCDDSDDRYMPEYTEVDERFTEAEQVTQTWCVETQRRVAGFDAAALPDSNIGNVVYEEKDEWASIKSRVAADEDPQIQIRVYIEPYCDAELPAPKGLSERQLCKMPNQDRIVDLLELTPIGEPGTCKSRNEDAFDWALAQLTEEERTAYETHGWPVTFLEDEVVNTGGAWLGLPANFELAEDGESYEIGSPSLQTEYDPTSTDPETPAGVHYCKLVTPAQALYWVLYRGFKKDPGICEEEACPIPDANPVGSCIFNFLQTGPPGEWYCEDYSGYGWTVAAAEEKCSDPNRRPEGNFKAVPCADRSDETSQIGELLGTCVITCGDLERLWRVYSGDVEEIGNYCEFIPVE